MPTHGGDANGQGTRHRLTAEAKIDALHGLIARLVTDNRVMSQRLTQAHRLIAEMADRLDELSEPMGGVLENASDAEGDPYPAQGPVPVAMPVAMPEDHEWDSVYVLSEVEKKPPFRQWRIRMEGNTQGDEGDACEEGDERHEVKGD